MASRVSTRGGGGAGGGRGNYSALLVVIRVVRVAMVVVVVGGGFVVGVPAGFSTWPILDANKKTKKQTKKG